MTVVKKNQEKSNKAAGSWLLLMNVVRKKKAVKEHKETLGDSGHGHCLHCGGRDGGACVDVKIYCTYVQFIACINHISVKLLQHKRIPDI